jgi:hypothetical protein
MNEKCQYCKRLLDDPKDPTTKDCGGDCLRCMGEIFEDPECVIAMLNIRIEAQADALKRARELRHGIRDAGVKRTTPRLYAAVIAFDAALAALDKENDAAPIPVRQFRLGYLRLERR